MRDHELISIFGEAAEIESETERERFLAQALGDNPQSLRRVRQLLSANLAAGNFLGTETVTERQATGAAEQLSSGISLIGKSIGPYKLLEQIGQGGMGAVYLAQQTTPINRQVALKVIKAGMDSKEVIARFEAERQALAMMDHPHIAKVLDGGTTEQGRPYFVMELVRGVPITDFCREKKLGLRERIELFIDVCKAVQHAHQKGVIHRDLKPSNLLVTMHDDKPVVKVIDFGIAKALNQEVTERTFFTQFSQMIGTPMYMAPEQAQMSGLDIDTRSDVYSLGVVLYELLTGAPPFDRDTLLKLGVDGLRKLLIEQEPERPSVRISTLRAANQTTIDAHRRLDVLAISKQLRRELDWIVMKALEKDRERRYASANAFAADLQRYLDNKPVAAHPPSIAYGVRKWVRRNRLIASVASTIAIALTITCAVAIWQVDQVRHAWKLSQANERQALDFLEASQYQTAITALRQGNLPQMSSAMSALASATHNRAYPSLEQASLANLLRRSAEPVPQEIYAHAVSVNDFSVAADSARMISVEAGGQVQLWDLAASLQGKVLGTHSENAHAVAISPDGTRAVSGSTSGDLWFWDLEQNRVIEQFQPVDAGIETIVWSPDGQYVAAGARYSQTWVFGANGEAKFHIDNDQRHEALLFSPDSKKLYVPTRQGIDVWDVDSGIRQTSFATSPISDVRAMCWAGPERQWLVAGERFSETLVILHRETGQQLGTLALGEEYAQHLAASDDGAWLAAAFDYGQILVLELVASSTGHVDGDVRLRFNPNEPIADSPGEPRWTVRWLPDSRRFLSSGSDGKIRLWDLDEIRPARVLDGPALSSSVRKIGAAYAVGELELVYYTYGHDILEDRPWHFDLFGKQLSPPGRCVPFSVQSQSKWPAEALIALAGPQQILISECETGRIVGKIASPHYHHWRVALAENAKVLATSNHEGQVTVWRSGDHWTTADLIGNWDSVKDRNPSIADAGRTLILGDANHDGITEWDLESGGIRKQYVASIETADFSLSRDSHLLAAAVERGIRVWDRGSSKVVLDISTRSEVKAIAFFGDDRVLVSGHQDQSIRGWHLPTGQSLGVLFQPEQPMGRPACVLPSADGSQLFVWYDNNESSRMVLIGRVLRR